MLSKQITLHPPAISGSSAIHPLFHAVLSSRPALAIRFVGASSLDLPLAILLQI